MLHTPLDRSFTKTPFKPLGSVLKKAGLVSAQQLEKALQTQAECNNLKIGEILASQGTLKTSTIHFFVDKFPQLLTQSAYQPIGQYLQAADLLDERQISEILQVQEQSDLKFGEISVRKGWIQQDTVNFFLQHFQSETSENRTPDTSEPNIADPSDLDIPKTAPPILLSPPHLGTDELGFVVNAFETNWIAPAGPHLDAFEQEFSEAVGISHAAALSSGTAGLHLALQLVGVEPGDEVFCSTLTFVASANPILYQGAVPVFIDSERTSWNMDPNLLSQALRQRARLGKLPKAVVLVHLYGQSADLGPILELCNEYDIPLIEDAAESLGATYQGKATGTFGRLGVFSFNGNKIITTSGGGMLVSEDATLIAKARFLSTQARDIAPHYQHSHLGFNYRLSNVLAGIGRGQLRLLPKKVAARRRIYHRYLQDLGSLPGLTLMPEPTFGQATHWLSCMLIDPRKFGVSRNRVQEALRDHQIESRPVWKPLHLQPLFARCDHIGGTVSEDLFNNGICLPSGSGMTDADLDRVIAIISSLAS